MTELRRWSLVAAAVVAALAGCGRADLAGRGRTAAAAVADPAWPQIPLADLDDRPTTLGRVLAGRPALVNFWAPWCERCKTELPALDHLARQLAGCAVVVGVAVGEDARHTAAFVHERGLVYPQVIDEQFHLADALHESRVPTTLVIDGAGTIVYAGWAVDEPALAALRRLLDRADAGGRCHGAGAAGAT